MQHTSHATDLAVRAASSEHVDPVMAAENICESVLLDVGDGTPALTPGHIDLAVLFVAHDHANRAELVAQEVVQRLTPGALVGVTCSGLVAGRRELEDTPAVSLLCAALPGTRLAPFLYRELPHFDPDDDDALVDLASAAGVTQDTRATLLFGDPFSFPAAKALEAFSALPNVVDGLDTCPVVGGLASAARVPGQNILMVNNTVVRHGAVGLTISGRVNVDTFVSQGCRPIGQPLLVTKAKRNIIMELAGRRAIDTVRDLVESLTEHDRVLLSNGLLLGRVINEYKDRFGLGDFLIRSVLGVDQNSGAIAVGDAVRVGQTVQFHVRDASTASSDLKLLLEAQRLKGHAAGALLFTCNGRGQGLFASPDHDASTIARMLSDQDHADDDTAGADFPLAGCFAAGEFGPIGGRSFIHGHSASVAVFRDADGN